MPRYTVDLIHTIKDTNVTLSGLLQPTIDEAIVHARLQFRFPQYWLVVKVTEQDTGKVVYDPEAHDPADNAG